MNMPFSKMFYSLSVAALLALSNVAHAEVYNSSATDVSFNDKKLIDSMSYSTTTNESSGSTGSFRRDERVRDDDHKIKIKPSREYTQITSPVPEPETYAMLLVGLALVGFTARRRNK
jgi:hypothetical protein